MNPKLPGRCAKCDTWCYEHENMPELKIHGPLPTARKVNFILMNGSTMDVTMCLDCVETMTPADYGPIWGRIMDGWIQESGFGWPATQADNGIMGVRNVQEYV